MSDKNSDTSTDTPQHTAAEDGHNDTPQPDHDASAEMNLYDRGTPDALRRAIDKLQGVHPGAEALPERPVSAIMRPSTSALEDEDDTPATSEADIAPADSTSTAADDDLDKTGTRSATASEAPAAGEDDAAILSSWDDDSADTALSTDSGDTDLIPAASANMEEPQKQLASAEQTPWTLQQFFNGEIDLDVELSKRFPNMPMMTSVKFRTLGSKSGRRVATTTTQDGSSSLVIDADMETKAIQLSFTYGSMMTLRYSLINLNDIDRSRWLELMNREQGGLAFLWGPSRWQDDYLICIGRKYFTNLYAFSPNQFESAVRLSPGVISDLLQWLDDIWHTEPDDDSDDDDTQLLTW